MKPLTSLFQEHQRFKLSRRDHNRILSDSPIDLSTRVEAYYSPDRIILLYQENLLLSLFTSFYRIFKPSNVDYRYVKRSYDTRIIYPKRAYGRINPAFLQLELIYRLDPIRNL